MCHSKKSQCKSGAKADMEAGMHFALEQGYESKLT